MSNWNKLFIAVLFVLVAGVFYVMQTGTISFTPSDAAATRMPSSR